VDFRVLGNQPYWTHTEAPPRAARASQRRRRALKTAPLGRPARLCGAAGVALPPLPMDQKKRFLEAACLRFLALNMALIIAHFSAPTSQAPLPKARPWRCTGAFLQCACMGGGLTVLALQAHYNIINAAPGTVMQVQHQHRRGINAEQH
jgi:hypothetical protein